MSPSMSFALILLQVPFVVCFGLGLQVLNALINEPQPQVRRIVYIVASLHQHSECVYLGKPTYTRDLHTYCNNVITQWLLEQNWFI